MKNLKVLRIFILLFILSTSSYSQWIFNFKCGHVDTSSLSVKTDFGTGMTKPMSTIETSNPDYFFRVLLVYVEFKNDNAWPNTNWPYQQPPVYANDLFAPVKELGINAYEDYYISNYFNQISNDKFDMIGDVIHIILDKEYSHYAGGGCYSNAMLDVMRMLDTNQNVDWRDYDLWSYNDMTGEFEMTEDGYIDMMYVQFRRSDFCGLVSGGFASLGVNYSTLNFNKQIDGRQVHPLGSGVMGINGNEMPIQAAIGYFRHEYSHYTLGDHRPYSTILGQDGTNKVLGSELGYSPQDLITVGLAEVTTFDPDNTETYNLDDMQTTGEMLKIPTGTSGEYFLISNRRRLAGVANYMWDCNMQGDTSMGQPYNQFHDYSKGLYIYHVNSGNDFQGWADLECADGLWDWSLAGYSTTPDWHPSQQLPVFIKSGIGYNDDNPESQNYDNTRMSSRDGHSLADYTNSVSSGYHQKWFEKGDRHNSLGQNGVDRAFTNLQED